MWFYWFVPAVGGCKFQVKKNATKGYTLVIFAGNSEVEAKRAMQNANKLRYHVSFNISML